MPIRTAYTAKIDHLQIMDEQGRIDPALGAPGTPLPVASCAAANASADHD